MARTPGDGKGFLGRMHSTAVWMITSRVLSWMSEWILVLFHQRRKKAQEGKIQLCTCCNLQVWGHLIRYLVGSGLHGSGQEDSDIRIIGRQFIVEVMSKITMGGFIWGEKEEGRRQKVGIPALTCMGEKQQPAKENEEQLSGEPGCVREEGGFRKVRTTNRATSCEKLSKIMTIMNFLDL